MLRLTRLTNTDPLLLRMMKMMVLMSLVVLTAAQPQCDPLTQYEDRSQCCKMCGPGTSMTSLGTCEEPQCQACNKDEYQDRYTKEPKCERQPYCDKNNNFDTPEHDPKKRSICMCKEGFHCSDPKNCLTCVPHSLCKRGSGVQLPGNHSLDTVCEECPDGTYSDVESSVVGCKKWTTCGLGQHVEERGTSTSDAVCGRTLRTHVVIAIVVSMIVAIIVAVVLFYLCRGKCGEEKVKGCFQSCREQKSEPLQEEHIFIPEQPDPLDEEESMSPDMHSTQEEGFTRTPEEDDELSVPMSPTALTDRGNLVTQENGKTEQLSRQESQTQCTDSFDTSM
ncbi:tumor necrosis factor receptor superfamily member 5 isoform X1 [Sparus aurata]|uniref:CD40 molecule, TNF receptor superfamily member 5 n=1 Tax=Sparus aurata TaxID=8175 RepID=A0A671U2E3_SPAAU|nr:tumor necrosis factor receptor superfamily member 5-like isoform X1 [Sparus aurata]